MAKLIKFALFTQHDLTYYITFEVNVSQQVAPSCARLLNRGTVKYGLELNKCYTEEEAK